MKNRLSLLLVAGALAIPAMAADAPKAEWNVYGTLVTEITNVKVSGSATATNDIASRNRFTCATSNLGFKGGFQATSDIKVIWQIESSVGVDGDAPSTWAGRNTALGLEGKWGTFLAGQWDTPYKEVQMKMGAFPTSLASDLTIVNTPGFAVAGTVTAGKPAGTSADACFNRRAGNSIQYWSPLIEGFQAKVLYSMDEGKATTQSPTLNPTLLSVGLSYQNGPLVVRYAFEQHNDYNGMFAINTLANTVGSKDTGNELSASYAFPTKTKINAIVEQLKYSAEGVATGSVSDYKRTAWYLTASQDIDAHKIWCGFGTAGKGTRTVVGGSDTKLEDGATQYSLGYGYTLAKGATLFADVFGVINDKDGAYAPQPALGTVKAGGDTKGFGIGMIYKF